MKIPEILLVEAEHKPGSLARVLTVIGEAGLVVEHLATVSRSQGRTVWEITLEMDEADDQSLFERIDALPNARVLGKSDRVFNRHRGGKIRTVSSMEIGSIQILRDLYTPGVARVCLAIQRDPSLARQYTNLQNTVAIVTNGTAILGLGDIGALAGLPVMEGKAALFASLAGISGVPILIEEKEPARVIETVAAIAPSFGAIQLEDIGAPACFEIEQALVERLDIPVLHDDQHGTAVVTLAAVRNAGRIADQRLSSSVVGQIGLGAAGIGIARLLRARGVERILGADLDPDAVARFDSTWWRARGSGADHGRGRHRDRHHRRQGSDTSRAGARRSGRAGAVEPGTGDRAAGRDGRRRGLRRGRAERQQRARISRSVPRCAGCGRATLYRRDAAGGGGGDRRLRRHRQAGPGKSGSGST